MREGRALDPFKNVIILYIQEKIQNLYSGLKERTDSYESSPEKMAVVESAVKYALAHESAVLAQTRLSPRKQGSRTGEE